MTALAVAAAPQCHVVGFVAHACRLQCILTVSYVTMVTPAATWYLISLSFAVIADHV